MTLRDQLIRTFKAYCTAVGRSEARVSTLLFGSGGRWTRLLADGDVTTGRWERAMLWLSDHWPDGAEWPAGITRPRPSSDVAPLDCSPEPVKGDVGAEEVPCGNTPKKFGRR